MNPWTLFASNYTDMDRFVCIHCHFYQPPRENPWLEAIELQDSAEPYHDWNERIAAECYTPNANARILSPDGRIQAIVNNYASISFNFGPTLLSWMAEAVPETYAAILEADRQGMQRFGGHGNAIAQVYNHMILPLANPRDKQTQVYWGLRDFQTRFGRDPEGMWLAETAADVPTLECLADNGIRFTILAQHQAKGVRKLGHGGRFRSVEGGKIDPTRAYVCKLPSGKTINLFFYDGPISQAVAFEGLLNNGETFANRILGGFSANRDWPQLMHIATDGETYGHHHRHGEMALAYALRHIEEQGQACITNYGEFLERFPATHEVEIINNTSWSCAHGVERWKSDCGCNSGMKAGWSQAWRAPLRNALDGLREELRVPFEQSASGLLRDPWMARDRYIDVILDRSPERLEAFFNEYAEHLLSEDERIRALRLLEMQRHAMLMYTSCGWFFDELSGIETVQVIMYAGRALQLAQEIFGDHHEERFLARLAEAHSNIAEHQNGAVIYERWGKPAQVDLLKVAAHYAISALFDRYEPKSSIFCYDVDLADEERTVSGKAQLAIGRATIRSRITLDRTDATFGVLHFGDHNLSAGVRHFRGEDHYKQLVEDAVAVFRAADLPATLRALDRHFEGVSYSLRSLFKDEQRKVLREILRTTMEEVESSYTLVYEHHAPLMDFFAEIGSPLPSVLRLTSEFVLNAQMRRGFAEEDPIPVAQLRSVLATARREQVSLGANSLAFVISRRLNRMAGELPADPTLETLTYLNDIMSLVSELPFEISAWKLQNRCFDYMQTVFASHLANDDRAWIETFIQLADKLRLQLPSVPEPVFTPAQAA